MPVSGTEHSFYSTVMTFHNLDIHALLGKIMSFRIQLITRPELRRVSGWNDALTNYISRELERISDQLAVTTHSMSGRTRDDWRTIAKNTEGSLADSYDKNTLAADELLGPPGVPRTIVWDLTGTDPNIPQLDPNLHQNTELRHFIILLDRLFVEASRCQSRHNPRMIDAADSAILRVHFLEPLYALNERYGGSVNSSDAPNGVLPSEEPETFQG